MKIKYIVNARIPTEKAHGYQICKMCEEFALAGNEVELIVPDRKNLIRGDVFGFYDLRKNFRVKYLWILDLVRFDKILRGRWIYFTILFFFLRLVFLSLEKDVVVFTRNPEIAWLFQKRGFKTIYEAHSWPESKVWLYKFFLRGVKIVSITQGLKDEFLEIGFRDEDILVAPDGVDLEKFDIDVSQSEAREKLDLPQDKFILGYTGNFKTFGKDKGLGDILRAVKKLKDDGFDCLFVAVGGSKVYINEYKKIARDLGIENNVLLRERVRLSELAIYQKAFSAVLMAFPNIKHYAKYMSPLKMFEYMASKRPIIASDLPSVREVLNDENSFLFKGGNLSSLVEVVKELMDNRELRNKKSQQAYWDVTNYTWKNRTSKIINFF